MKPFRFNLQALLLLREREERKALEAHGRDVQAARAALERAQAAQLELEGLWSGLSTLSARGAAVFEVMQLQAYAATVRERKKQLDAALLAAQKAESESRRRFMEARQQREAVERFREKKKKRHDHAAALEEQALLDDLSQRDRSLGAAQAEMSLS